MSEHAENLAAMLMPEDDEQMRELITDMIADGLLAKCEQSEEEHYHVTEKGRRVWAALEELREAEVTARAILGIYSTMNGN